MTTRTKAFRPTGIRHPTPHTPHPALPTKEFHVTRHGSVLGTPAFMAPEQAAGDTDRVGVRSDVFGLGAVMCAALTGRPPFEGTDTLSVLVNATRGDTAAAFARLDGCGADPAVTALCKRCLSFDPADRPASGAEVAAGLADLRRASDERARQAERERHAVEVRAAEQGKRRRMAVGAAAAVAAVLLAGTGVSVWQAAVARKEAHDADTARANEETAHRAADAARVDAEAKRAAAERAQAEEANQRGIAERAAKAEAAQKVVAEKQRNEAETQKGLADERLARSEATLRFFTDHVFAAARPTTQPGGLGADVTLRAAITASLPSLAVGFRDQPQVEAVLRTVLADTFLALGDAGTAGQQWQRAGALYSLMVGPEDPKTLDAAFGMAACLNAIGKPAESLKMFQKLLAIQEKALPQDDPLTLHTREATAKPLEALGRGPEAIRVREEVLAACRKSLPKDHAQTLGSLGDLADAYKRAGRAKEAVGLQAELLVAYERTRPKDHPDVIRATFDLALCHSSAGDPEEAVRLGEAAAAAGERSLPPNHPVHLRCVGGLSDVYLAAGRPADAVKARQKAVAAYQKTGPADHEIVLACRYGLADYYAAAGRPDDALTEHQAVLVARRRVLPTGHVDTLRSLATVARSLDRMNRRADAAPFADEYVDRAANNLAADPQVVTEMTRLRFDVSFDAKDAKGCRATTERWEKQSQADKASLFLAARYRAITAALEKDETLAAADANKAMDRLTKAVARGFADRKRVETDEGLDAIRGRADFKKLLDAMPKADLAPH